MRWQRIARLAIAVFVLVFAGVVFKTLRRTTAPVVPSTTPRVDQKTIAEFGQLTHTRTNSKGEVTFVVNAKRHLTYPGGRSVFQEAEITLPDRNGRTMVLGGGEIEVIIPENSASPIETATITKGAKLKASDGLEVTSDRATYDERTGMVTVPGEVQFTRARLTGSGFGATYDKGRDVFWLLDRARLTVKADATGAGAAEATAKAIGLARAEHYVKLTGDAHVVGEGRVLDAQEITVQLAADDSVIQSTAMRGSSRITGAAAGAAAQGMSARDIDLTYAPDGRTLQKAHLVEDAVVELAGGDGARRVAARVLDLTLGADGSTVTGLEASQNVQVDLPSAPDAPARRITAATLSAGGPSGLQTATFGGGVDYREIRPPRRGGPAPGERTARSQRLTVVTQPGFGTLQQADFRGSVHIADGETTADGQRAIYHVAQDSFDVVLSPGDPGPSPTVNDGRVLVSARTINFSIGSKRLKAEGDVRSSVQPSRGQSAKGGPAPAGRGRGATADASKLPSMLKQDQPVNVTATKLDYDGAAGEATYTGAARLWQDKTQIQGDVIVVDDRNGNLTARGRVATVMFFEEVDSKTKTKRLVETTATSDTMVYVDAKRIATYTAGPTARAHMVGTQGDITADTIQLFMKAGASELDRAEADGAVIVKEGVRTITGQHLIYTPVNETYVMTGAPLEVEEKTPTECRISTATSITFQRGVDSMVMDNNNGGAPVKFRQCTGK